MNKQTIISIIVVVVIVVAGLLILKNQESKPGQYDGLAACISDSGATFFGAFWCPHCNDQKAAFGKSASLLPYTECSNPDGSQNELCTAEGIESYPTWEFADGERLTGEQSLETLAQRTECEAFLNNTQEESEVVEGEDNSTEATLEE